MKKSVVVFLLLALYAITSVSAVDTVIVNSEDWRDVYSTINYGNLMGYPKNFLVSDRHSRILAETLDRNKKDIQLISSMTVPFVVGYSSVLRDAGFNVDEISVNNINLDLARRVNVNKFIIVDDAYGYNAIAVAPYAALNKDYVLFADRRNIDDIVSLLQGKTLGELIVYGHVDREVKAALAQFNPLIINKEDRFDNNVEIVKLYQEKYKAQHGDINKQAVLSNGEFIEEEVMSGAEPVLFLGKQNVPDQIKNYIADSGLEVAVLIGNQYVGAATNIRRQIGISVFVKFARGARIPSGPISPVEGLDLFYVPTYKITMQIAGIRYNSATNRLEVTIQNTGPVAAYFKGSYSLSSELGPQGTVGDLESVFIESNSLKTMSYEVTLAGANLTTDAYVIYGESPRALENEIRQRFVIEKVRVIDNSQVDIIGLVYDLKKGIFYVEVKNIGSADAYVHVELVNVVIDGERYSFGSEGVTKLSPGRTAKIKVRPNPIMTEIDIEDNQQVTVQADFGERQENLVKSLRKQLPLVIKRIDYVYYSVVAVLVILLLLLLLVLTKKKCPECKHRNPRRKRTCQKCGSKLR
jgi:archaellum component FlaF (FlaF/FlaG flagellin family)